jgi:hypothetical protein
MAGGNVEATTSKKAELVSIRRMTRDHGGRRGSDDNLEGIVDHETLRQLPSKPAIKVTEAGVFHIDEDPTTRQTSL